MVKRGERIYCKVTTSDLCKIHDISTASLLRDIRLGKLNPSSLNDIIKWATSPRIRSNKGKPLHWLNKKGMSES